jgi:BTB And C-terminal Kelch
VFQTIVHYVYTGKIEAPKHVLQTVDLMQAAAKYDIVPLHSVIKEFLQKRLPKLRIKHFIMITQRVLDLNVTELEQECFTLAESRTDQVVQDPMFLRVSSTFIARLLELDNFSGISEAAVFARVMEWATLRSGGSILPFHADRSLLSDDANHLQEAGFHLTRPDVRSVLEAFIRSFRLTSVPKDDLAGLVKNSGVFTEHEQLVVSYYLLDQTKNLEDFCMKPRGTKIGLFLLYCSLKKLKIPADI